jgi:hypothetical protein
VDRPQRLARRQEREGAESYGGRLTPASGSLDAKGDAESAEEHIEFKHTERKSFSLKLDDLLRTARHAILAHKRMVFEVEFTRPDGTWPVRFVVLNKDEYMEMRDELDELRREVQQQAVVLAEGWLKDRAK